MAWSRREDSARTRRKILISTQVSPHAERLRLTFNGWWQSSWWPRDEPRLDATLEDPVARSKLTHSQRQSIADMLADPWQNLGPERHARLLSLSERRTRVCVVVQRPPVEPPSSPVATILISIES